MTLPLISCITVSQPPRLPSLSHAVADFCRQTYTPRELVIVVDDADYAEAVSEMVRSFEDGTEERIFVVNAGERLRLGALRNLGTACAQGEWLCQWDDDDRYSPHRLALQAEALAGTDAAACFLHQQLHFFVETRELYWTDWRLHSERSDLGPLNLIIPGTVLWRRCEAAYPEQGAIATRGEDSRFAAHLIGEGALGLDAPPETYFRTFHTCNTWDREHHRYIATRRSVAPAELSAHRSPIQRALAEFSIHSPVHVMSGEGLAFSL